MPYESHIAILAASRHIATDLVSRLATEHLGWHLTNAQARTRWGLTYESSTTNRKFERLAAKDACHWAGV